MMRRRRTVLAGAAVLILVAAPAHADLDFGDITDALDEFLKELMIPVDIPDWVSEIPAVYQSVAGLFEGLSDGLYEAPPVTIDETMENAVARTENTLERTNQQFGTILTSVGNLLETSLKLGVLDELNVEPVSLFASLQIANKTQNLIAQQLGEANALTAQMWQTTLDQHVQEDYARIVAVEQAKAFLGNAALEGGPIEGHTLHLDW